VGWACPYLLARTWRSAATVPSEADTGVDEGDDGYRIHLQWFAFGVRRPSAHEVRVVTHCSHYFQDFAMETLNCGPQGCRLWGF
jgi:hypothetical protein